MQALKRRFKRSAEDEADDPDADIQRGMWKNHKLLPPALPAKVRYWDPLLLICSLYFFVTLPLILCFGLQPSIGWLVRARAAGRAYTHKQALAHGVKDGCIDSSMSSGAAASMVM